MRNRNIRIVGCCQTVMLFDKFAVGGGNDKGRFLKDVFFHGFRERVIETRANIFCSFTFYINGIADKTKKLLPNIKLIV